jgi:DNA polymerase (family 10)
MSDPSSVSNLTKDLAMNAIEGLDSVSGLTNRDKNRLGTLGVTTLAELRKRVEREDQSVLAVLPPASYAQIKFNPEKTMVYNTAKALADQLVSLLVVPKNCYVMTVGSVRRKKPRGIKDVDLLVVAKNGVSIPGILGNMRIDPNKRPGDPVCIVYTYATGDARQSFVVSFRGVNYCVDTFTTSEKEFPFALLHHTGSKEYNIKMRRKAISLGWKISQHGLVNSKTNEVVPGSEALRTEGDVEGFLGMNKTDPVQRG